MCALTPAPAPAQGESWRWVLALERCEVRGGWGWLPLLEQRPPPQLPWHHGWGCSRVGGSQGRLSPRQHCAQQARCHDGWGCRSPIQGPPQAPGPSHCHLPVLLALSAPGSPCATRSQRCPCPCPRCHGPALSLSTVCTAKIGRGTPLRTCNRRGSGISQCTHTKLLRISQPHLTPPRSLVGAPLLLQQGWMWGSLWGAADVSPAQRTA